MMTPFRHGTTREELARVLADVTADRLECPECSVRVSVRAGLLLDILPLALSVAQGTVSPENGLPYPVLRLHAALDAALARLSRRALDEPAVGSMPPAVEITLPRETAVVVREWIAAGAPRLTHPRGAEAPLIERERAAAAKAALHRP